MVRFLSLVVLALGLVEPVQAQCRTRFVSGHRVISTPHHVPVVVKHHDVVKEVVVKEVLTPVAVPLVVPAFTFQYSPPCYAPAPAYPQLGAPVYGQPHVPQYGQQPYAQPYTQPYAQPHAQQPFAQQPFTQQPVPSSKDKIRELAKAILEEMSKQSEDGGPPAVFDPNQQQQPPPPQGPPPQGAPQPQGGRPSSEQAAPFAIAALQRNCAACHTGNGSRGDFVIFSQPGVLNQQASWRSILREVNSGRMPPKASQFRLSPEETEAIRAWLSGAGNGDS